MKHHNWKFLSGFVLIACMMLLGLLCPGGQTTVSADLQRAQLLGDLHPGTARSDPSLHFALNNLLVYTPEFLIDAEPWVTDGTPAGTRLLKNFVPDGFSYLSHLMTANGWAYFSIADGEHGNELWRTDGTPDNTTLVADINPGPEGSYPAMMVNQGDWLYFVASTGYSAHLWRTDGTPANTQQVGAVNIAKPGLGVFNSRIFSLVYDPDTGVTNLWRTTQTGEDGENLNVSICQGYCPAYDSAIFQVMDGKLYFTINNRLWVSDGTGSGTSVVKVLDDPDIRPQQLTGLGSKLYLTAGDGTGKQALWISDGTESGTHLVASQAGQQAFSHPTYLTISGGKLYFSASDPVHGNELWAVDNTGEAYLVKDLAPGLNDGTPIDLIDINGTLFFAGGDSDGVYGAYLWRSQGSTDDTLIVKDINPNGSDRVSYLTAWNGKLAFSAGDGAHGEELWFSDGTPAGTAMMFDQNTQPAGGFVLPGKIFKDMLYFTKADGERNLWKSDGTSQGTKVFYPGISPSLASYLFYTRVYDSPAELDGILYFRAWDAGQNSQLWRTDGTPVGTYPITDQNSNDGGMEIVDVASADGYVWFTVYKFLGFMQDNYTLYRTDGTLAGATPIQGLMEGQIAVLNNRGIIKSGANYYRTAPDGSIEQYAYAPQTEQNSIRLAQISGNRLYFSDGSLQVCVTDGNTVAIIKEAGTDADIYGATDLTSLNGDIYFSGDFNFQRWILKIPAGSDKAIPIKHFSSPNSPRLLTPLGNKIVFKVGEEYVPGELWVTDGTENGTRQLCLSCDVHVGLNMEAHQGKAFFDGIDTAHGTELWATDGTDDGTALFMDIYPGMASSNPLYLFSMGDTLFFSADDGLHGMEPWVVPSYRKVFLPLVRR